MSLSSSPGRQRGLVLFMALVFSAMLAVVAARALQVATLEMRMAGNATSRMFALEQADSILVNILERPESFPLSSAPGEQVCDPARANAACSALADKDGRHADYSVTRIAPALQRGFLLREPESLATGVDHFDTALFEVAVTVGSRDERSGFAQVVQGVALRVPAVSE